MKLIVTQWAAAMTLAMALPASLLAQADTGMKHGSMGMKKDAMGMSHNAMGMMMAKGTFEGADGHPVTGSYEIVSMNGKHMLKTSADLSVDPKAPDVYVVLSNGPKVGKEQTVWLGKLTSHMGAQAFAIPAGAKLDGTNTVVLWCKKYGVTIGTASFDPTNLMHDMMKKDAMKPMGGR